ncbi:uncharacterized protein LOC119396284 [Rhipicephalus sanguineus]|uniref:uncharacterized protein LOC119396284 n=1 Tax=Rhipicephalus sanguineus TaxID=34632 RepID=UPI00189448C4|nr:uncharacterized protein LOC119396284 [Rhipicephalus sanguineus]
MLSLQQLDDHVHLDLNARSSPRATRVIYAPPGFCTFGLLAPYAPSAQTGDAALNLSGKRGARRCPHFAPRTGCTLQRRNNYRQQQQQPKTSSAPVTDNAAHARGAAVLFDLGSSQQDKRGKEPQAMELYNVKGQRHCTPSRCKNHQDSRMVKKSRKTKQSRLNQALRNYPSKYDCIKNLFC